MVSIPPQHLFVYLFPLKYSSLSRLFLFKFVYKNPICNQVRAFANGFGPPSGLCKRFFILECVLNIKVVHVWIQQSM